MTKKRAEEIAGIIAHRAVTYAQLEAAAGITDREEFWRDKTEEQGRIALREMIIDRVRRGDRVTDSQSIN